LGRLVLEILTYFALGKRQQIQGIIAINQSLIKQFLELTGPIYLTDYHQQVNANNFDQILQSRGRFFPGDHKKKHLLTLIFDQLTFKLPQMIKNRPQELLTMLKQAASTKDIQAFSLNQSWQHLFRQLDLDNQLDVKPNCINLALIESNVGINKINSSISREVYLKLVNQPQTQLNVTIHLTNQAPISQPGKNEYVDYQRILVAPTWQKKSILINDRPVEKIDDELITTASGNRFRQLGFLVLVKPKRKTTVTIKLSNTNLAVPTRLCLFKQSGLATTSYHLNLKTGQSKTMKLINLDHDQEVDLTH